MIVRRVALAGALAGALGGCGSATAPRAATEPAADPATSTTPATTTTTTPVRRPDWSVRPDLPRYRPTADHVRSRPRTIAIPSIGVDAGIIELGTLPDGSMETPENIAEVGWYRYGAAPGEKGAAVLAAHVDGRNGPGAFFALRDLAPGAIVRVTSDDGRTRNYTVQRAVSFPKTEFPTAAVFGPESSEVLRLVTCGGAFDRATGHYRENLVVTALPA